MNLDVRSINHGFKMTKISKFQSEPTIETELTRNEQIMNLIESFDKFACSDSEQLKKLPTLDYVYPKINNCNFS